MTVLLTLIMACSAAAWNCPAAADSVDTLSQTLRQISVSGHRVRSQLRSEGAVSILGMSLMDNMPRILGNADPMHYAQMLPGVQTSSEYDAGLHIQGSDNSHNIVGIDGVPIYNVAHMLGFFSVFNSSHFSSMKLSRSTLSPSTANRIGGAVDMQVGDSIVRHMCGEVSVGPMSSQGTVRLPVGCRSSMTLSARASYINLLYSKWLKVDGEKMNYFFHDYNFTYRFRPNVRNMIWLEAYYGGDDVSYGGSDYDMETSLRWNNIMAALHWRHHSGRLYFNQCAYYTRYSNRFGLEQTTASVVVPSSLGTLGYKFDFQYGRANAGIDVAWHTARPQEPHVEGAFSGGVEEGLRQSAVEVSSWFGWQQPIGTAMQTSLGLRSVLYFSNGGVAVSADPTVAFSWHFSQESRLKLDFGIKHQYMFKTGFSDIGLPTEFWFSSGYGQSPQYVFGSSLMAESYLFDREWRVEAGLYYKQLFNQIEYVGNVFDFIFDSYSLDNVLLCGKGFNYGLNLLVERRKGTLTGWVAYSFGRARRRYPGTSHSGWYSASHERPHELNAVATLNVGRRWRIGATLVVASGTPFTRVERLYMIGNNVLCDYGLHNGERLPLYYRLDFSVSYDFRVRSGRRSGVNLSIYNVTAHENVLFYRLKVNDSGYGYRPFSFALRIMPSVNYYYSF